MAHTIDEVYAVVAAIKSNEESHYASLNSRLGNIETRIGNLESSFDNINGNNLKAEFDKFVAACQQAVTDCKNDVANQLKTIKSDLEQITSTAASMDDCYNEIFTCAGDIKTKVSEISVIVGGVADLSTRYSASAANVESAGKALSDAVSKFSSEVAEYKTLLGAIQEANSTLITTVSNCAESIRDTANNNLGAFQGVTVEGYTTMLNTIKSEFDTAMDALRDSMAVIDAKVLNYAEQIKNASISLASYSQESQSASVDLLRTLDVANQVIEKVTALASKVQLSDMTLQQISTAIDTMTDNYKDLKQQLIKNNSTDRSIRIVEAVASSVSAASDAKQAFAPATKSNAKELL